MSQTSFDPLDFHGQGIQAHLGLLQELFGAWERWIRPETGPELEEWIAAFVERSHLDSQGGRRIEQSEQVSLRSISLPPGTSADDADRFIRRWNRTVENWAAGVLSRDETRPGESTDFMDAPSVAALMRQREESQRAAEKQGFSSPFHAVAEIARIQLSQPDEGGVCARVRIRLEQEAVLTRSAFRAHLELENGSSRPLTDLRIDLRLRTSEGLNAAELFGIRSPVLSGINALDGSGILAGQSTGSASWVLIPTLDAAPAGPTQYLVGGVFSYTENSTRVTIPLADVPITVHPGPELVVEYFHQRDVFSDDPFTTEQEASIPYNLGVMVRNVGRGTARNFRITSGQPQIVDNEKGLLIDFNLIATEVAGQNLTPSLTAFFGDIPPGTNAVGRWLFTSTLQGLFIDYSATFEHLDAIAGRRLSIITNVSIHEMNHLVQADRGFDDGRPDFLVNDEPDLNDRPDTLYLSDGTRQSVTVVEQADAGTPTLNGPTASLSATMPRGWTYLRVPEPSDGSMRLIGIRRADGTSLVRDNFWVTDRTFIGLGRRPLRENRLHLLDHDSQGIYTLVYEALPAPDTTAPASEVMALPAFSYEQIPLAWSAVDEPGGSGVAGVDIWISENDSPPRAWLTNLTQSGAIFPGQPGSRYAFYSIALDRNGNREPAPAAPDTRTTTSLTNRPPTLERIEDQIIDEGGTLQLALTASDPDGAAQALAFHLMSGPPGMTLDPRSGLLAWVTGEGHGPGTNLVSVRIVDNGTPALTNSQTFRVIAREVNSAPVLLTLPEFKISERQLLTFTNLATDSDLPLQSLGFSLDADAPTGASMDETTGVFQWRPNETQGGTTNVVSVVVTDDGFPPLSATQSVRIIVRNSSPDFTILFGGTNVLAGEHAEVPVRLNSGLELASLSLELHTPGGRLTNLTLAAATSEISEISFAPYAPDRARVHVAAFPGQEFQGSLRLAQLLFDTFAGRSAIIPLQVANVLGVLTSGTTLTNGQGIGERIFLIGDEPLLDATSAVHSTNATRTLTLYGPPGASYRIESTSNLDGTLIWDTQFEVDLTGTFWNSPPLSVSSPEVFYRALKAERKPALRIASVNRSGDEKMRFQLTGSQNLNYYLESSTNLIQWHVVSTNFGSSQTVEADPSIAPYRYFRLHRNSSK